MLKLMIPIQKLCLPESKEACLYVHIEYALRQHPRDPEAIILEMPMPDLAAALYDCLVQGKGTIALRLAEFSRDYRIQKDSVAPGSVQITSPAFNCVESGVTDWQIIEAAPPGRQTVYILYYKGQYVPVPVEF
jgi:hypothetical protein